MSIANITYFLILNTFFLAQAGDFPLLKLPSGEEIEVEIARTTTEKSVGLSGRKKDSFPVNRAMFFEYASKGPRQFWMPNTFMNLDIFFLSSENVVIAVERNVKAHPGFETPPEIARTKAYNCRNVLEMRADSKISQKILKGSVLKWVRRPKTK